jgi:hypothetical protein
VNDSGLVTKDVIERQTIVDDVAMVRQRELKRNTKFRVTISFEFGTNRCGHNVVSSHAG